MRPPESSRIAFLEPRDELLNLAWPPLLLVLLMATQFFYGMPSKEHFNWLLFASGILFLNVIHNVFSLYIICLFPETRAWLAELPRAERNWLIARWMLVFLFWLAFFVFARRALQYWVSRTQATLIVTVITGYIAHYHHTISQVRGIAVAYNQSLRRNAGWDPANEVRLREIERNEKFLFGALLWTSGLGMLGFLLNSVLPRWVCGGLSVLLFAALILNSLKSPRASQSNKPIYLLRLIFFPLGLLHPLYALGTPFFHGVEFTFVYRKMWRRSAVRRLRFAGGGLVLVLLALTVGALTIARVERGLGHTLIQKFPEQQDWIFGLATFS